MMRVDKPTEDAENEKPPNRLVRLRKLVKEKQSTSLSNQVAKNALPDRCHHTNHQEGWPLVKAGARRHSQRSPYHAAALALVAWYLLTPSAHENQYGAVEADTSIPMSRWQRLGPYESVKACHQAKEDNIDRSMLLAKEMKTRIDGARVIVEASEAACIASDDPRIKEK
jgi:hypothetical protein